jgi:hypothetical protein
MIRDAAAGDMVAVRELLAAVGAEYPVRDVDVMKVLESDGVLLAVGVGIPAVEVHLLLAPGVAPGLAKEMLLQMHTSMAIEARVRGFRYAFTLMPPATLLRFKARLRMWFGWVHKPCEFWKREL